MDLPSPPGEEKEKPFPTYKIFRQKGGRLFGWGDYEYRPGINIASKELGKKTDKEFEKTPMGFYSVGKEGHIVSGLQSPRSVGAEIIPSGRIAEYPEIYGPETCEGYRSEKIRISKILKPEGVNCELCQRMPARYIIDDNTFICALCKAKLEKKFGDKIIDMDKFFEDLANYYRAQVEIYKDG